MRLGHHGRQREAGGPALRPPHLGDAVLRALRQHHPLLAGPAQAVQPVVQRAAVGEDLPPLPAPPGVFVAGGPHHARHRRRGPGRDHADAEHLRGLHGERAGHARPQGPQDRQGEVQRRGGDLHRGVHDARPQGPPGRHQPLLRRRLRQGLRHHLHRQGQPAPLSPPDLLGRQHPDDRRHHHDPRR